VYGEYCKVGEVTDVTRHLCCAMAGINGYVIKPHSRVAFDVCGQARMSRGVDIITTF